MVDKKFIQDCLKTHNECRSRHQVSNLKQNKDICIIAQKWADYLAQTNTFEHNRDRDFKGERLGENIAMKWTSGGDEFTGEQVTDQWYSEVERYDFGRNSGPSTGHFSQIVWKDSKEFGIGKAKTSDGKWIVVANYSPAGNWLGKYNENVFPPKGGKDGGASGGKGFSMPSFLTRKSSKDDGKPVPVKESVVTHTPDYHRYHTTKADPPSSTSSSRSTTKSTREETGPGGYKKTIVTETTIGPDGKKSTVTRETVTHGDDDFRDIDKQFEELGVADEPKHKSQESRVKDDSDDDDDWKTSKTTKTYSYSTPVAEASGGDDKGKDKPQKMKDFIDEVVKTHNKYRKKHGKVGDLKHNKELTSLAQKWADHLAAVNMLKNSNNNYKGDQLGENVATKWSSGKADYGGQEVVDQWYKEGTKYDWSSPNYHSGAGNFTQVVWKASKEIGVGKSFSSDGRVFVVCSYHPGGNVLGQFADNVCPEH